MIWNALVEQRKVGTNMATKKTDVCARTSSGTKVCIRDSRYDQRLRRRGWNIDPTPLMAGDSKAARQAFPEMSKADHEILAREYAAAARDLDAKHSKAVDAAMKRHGLEWHGTGAKSPGSLISGIVSDKFDDATKDKLRDLAHTASRLTSASVLHWAGTGKRTPWHAVLGKNR